VLSRSRSTYLQDSDELARLREENEQLRAVRHLKFWLLKAHACDAQEFLSFEARNLALAGQVRIVDNQHQLCAFEQIVVAALNKMSGDARESFLKQHAELRAMGSTLGEKLPEITRDGMLAIIQEAAESAEAVRWSWRPTQHAVYAIQPPTCTLKDTGTLMGNRLQWACLIVLHFRNHAVCTESYVPLEPCKWTLVCHRCQAG
jgi:hypothetical protein